jgi:chemotaxis protein histidine kinase CheA
MTNLRADMMRKPIERDINHKIIEQLIQFRKAEQLEKAESQRIEAENLEKAQNELIEAQKQAAEAAAAKKTAEAAAKKTEEDELQLRKEQSKILAEAAAAKARQIEAERKTKAAEEARKEALIENDEREAQEAVERAKQAEIEKQKAIEEEAKLRQEAAEKEQAIEAEKLKTEETIEAASNLFKKAENNYNEAEKNFKKAALKKQEADKAAEDAKTKIYKASVTLKIGSDSNEKRPLYVETPIKVEYTSPLQVSDIDQTADIIVSTNASSIIDKQLQTIINRITSEENTDLKEAYESEEYYNTLKKYENPIVSNPPNVSALNMFTITVKYDIYLNGQEELRLRITDVIPNKSEPLTGKPISNQNKENLSFQSNDQIFTENAGIAYENPSNKYAIEFGHQGGKRRTKYKYNKKQRQSKKKNYKKKQSKKHINLKFKKQRKSRR